MTRIYLVRHGTHPLVGKVLAGRMAGVSLSADGRAQAAALAAHFGAMPVARVVSSPMERCRETAAPIGARLGLPVEIDPAFDELDCGEWTGLSFAALAGDPRWQAWNTERERSGMPGGEMVVAVRARVMAGLARLEAERRAPVIVVSHSDVAKVAILCLLGVDFDRHDRLEIDPGSVTTLDLWPGGGKVVRMNEEVRP